MNTLLTTLKTGLFAKTREPSGLVAALWQWCLVCHARTAQRRHLALLDEHTLKDIGITGAEARLEIDKPFWRA